MVFGAGYAGADDVVGHELTHGTSSAPPASSISTRAAPSTSRSPTRSARSSTTATRSRRRATPTGPSARTSPARCAAQHEGPDALRPARQDDQPLLRDAPTSDNDDGAVHDNDGVGNKTAYLISQGGTFNGQTVTGIDGGDAGLAKTGRLYLETIPRLTSGARVRRPRPDAGQPPATSSRARGPAASRPSTATSVSAAVAATELATPPTDPAAAAPEGPSTCPTGSHAGRADAATTTPFAGLRLHTRTACGSEPPPTQLPTYAASGDSSLFGWDPDPSRRRSPTASSASGRLHGAGRQPDLPATSTTPTSSSGTTPGHPSLLRRRPGARAEAGRRRPGRRDGLPWVNGPDEDAVGDTTTKVFGGDSHGYGSSQVDLTSLAGQTVRLIFRVDGDDDGYFCGWWVDDLRLYTCTHRCRLGCRLRSVAAGVDRVATVSWTAAGVPRHQPDRVVPDHALGREGEHRPGDGTVAHPDRARGEHRRQRVAWPRSTRTVRSGRPARCRSTGPPPPSPRRTRSRRRAGRSRVTAKVIRRGTTSVVAGHAGHPAAARRGHERVAHGQQRHRPAPRAPRSWSVKQAPVTYYRVVRAGVSTWFGTTSAVKTVLMR